jgi:signal transduction histidine kinase
VRALSTHWSIRWRLTVWYAAVLAGALALFSGLIWLSLRQRLVGEIDEELGAGASRFQAYLAREVAEIPESRPEQLEDELEEFCQALPLSDYLELQGTNGFEFRYPASHTLGAAHARMIERRFTIGKDTYHLQVSTSVRSIEHTLELLRWLLLSLVPVVIAIACAGGAWLSRRALKPVDEITSAARMIGIDNLSMRLPVPRTGDELQRLTEVWNTMLERLESAVKTLSQFAADASHELRTPLAVIRTSAELALRRARSPESYRGSLIEITEETERMTQLVENLLFLARNEARAADMPMEALDLDGLLREVSGELTDFASAREISIRYEGSADRNSFVRGNRQALRRLILVLLDNAIKYSRPGSEILLSREGSSFIVKDCGTGIAAADLPHIFERFYQADQARSDGGFGLGLSLADSIVRMHEAVIDVTSDEGKGSSFRVVFQSHPVTVDAEAQNSFFSTPRGA